MIGDALLAAAADTGFVRSGSATRAAHRSDDVTGEVPDRAQHRRSTVADFGSYGKHIGWSDRALSAVFRGSGGVLVAEAHSDLALEPAPLRVILGQRKVQHLVVRLVGRVDEADRAASIPTKASHEMHLPAAVACLLDEVERRVGERRGECQFEQLVFAGFLRGDLAAERLGLQLECIDAVYQRPEVVFGRAARHRDAT